MSMGTWWFKSESDPRWNYSTRGIITVWTRPPEVNAKLAELRALFGEMPDDLIYGGMKD